MSSLPRAPVALAALTGLATILAACAPAQPAPATSPGQAPAAPPAAQAQAPRAAPGAAGDLAACPARAPVLRIGGVFTSEPFSPHPMESRFSSISYSRLHNMPLFGADPAESKVDPAFGAAE